MDRSGRRSDRTRGRGVVPVVGLLLMTLFTVLIALLFLVSFIPAENPAEKPKEDFDRTLEALKGELVQASNRRAGATDVRYRINFSIGNASASLETARLTVTGESPNMFSNTESTDLERILVDDRNDGTVDREITGTDPVADWQISKGGSQLSIEFSGKSRSATLSSEDSVLIILDGVDNPADPGTYAVEVRTNDNSTRQGEITIIP